MAKISSAAPRPSYPRLDPNLESSCKLATWFPSVYGTAALRITLVINGFALGWYRDLTTALVKGYYRVFRGNSRAGEYDDTHSLMGGHHQ